MDFIDTVLGGEDGRLVDFLTIHPRTRHTPSREPINLEALQILTDKYGDRLPILVSGDVFTLGSLPFSSPLLSSSVGVAPVSVDGLLPNETAIKVLPRLPKLAGLMSARAILANPALYAGYDRCPWEAVELFINNVVRAPLPLKLVQHHLSEMCGPNMGPDKTPLLTKRERVDMLACVNMCELIDFLDEKVSGIDGRTGLRRMQFSGGQVNGTKQETLRGIS